MQNRLAPVIERQKEMREQRIGEAMKLYSELRSANPTRGDTEIYAEIGERLKVGRWTVAQYIRAGTVERVLLPQSTVKIGPEIGGEKFHTAHEAAKLLRLSDPRVVARWSEERVGPRFVIREVDGEQTLLYPDKTLQHWRSTVKPHVTADGWLRYRDNRGRFFANDGKDEEPAPAKSEEKRPHPMKGKKVKRHEMADGTIRGATRAEILDEVVELLASTRGALTLEKYKERSKYGSGFYNHWKGDNAFHSMLADAARLAWKRAAKAAPTVAIIDRERNVERVPELPVHHSPEPVRKRGFIEKLLGLFGVAL